MRQEAGFSMLEVLVALVIGMIGVLGMAGIQILAINDTERARYQSIAALTASSMVAEMQGNSAFWGATTVPTTVTVSGSAVMVNGVLTAGGNCNGVVCTSSQMAYYDLQSWGKALAGALPSGNGAIACALTTSVVCTIKINWTENNVALNNPTGSETGIFASGTVGARSYQTMVSIQ
ncbi:MAG: type IV pilus modification protein PilV [Burkholderiales bacterium]